MALQGGQGVATAEAPLVGRIYDTHANRFIERDSLQQKALASRFVILGEAHDNSVHHKLQQEILESLLRAGRKPALALEQIDHEHQPALDAAVATGEQDADRLADAARVDRKGWRWPEYKPLVELAVAYKVPILGANLSREGARSVIRAGRPAEGLEPVTAETRIALEKDIVQGHCGLRPPAAVLSGMIEAQRARDARMAETLRGAAESGVVLIAGAGHARRDRGAPAYLPKGLQDALLSIAFIEVDGDEFAPSGRFKGVYDVVWFTPREKREDPCKGLKLPER